MKCTGHIPVTSKRSRKAVMTAPRKAGHGKVAKEFRDKGKTSPNSGHSRYEEVVQRPLAFQFFESRIL